MCNKFAQGATLVLILGVVRLESYMLKGGEEGTVCLWPAGRGESGRCREKGASLACVRTQAKHYGVCSRKGDNNHRQATNQPYITITKLQNRFANPNPIKETSKVATKLHR